MINIISILPFALVILIAPLFLSVINRTKAFIAGRQGPPFLQPYYELWRLINKGEVISDVASWVFRLAPSLNLATTIIALALIPVFTFPALFDFSGNIIFLGYLFGLGRFATVLAALDTGSPFEGMGASREVWFAALVEPVFFTILFVIACRTNLYSFSEVMTFLSQNPSTLNLTIVIILAASLFLILLVENSRIPVDDPTTHLELTMIHEVMVLDNSGPDFAFIEIARAVKLAIYTLLIVGLGCCFVADPLHKILLGTFLTVMIYVGIGLVESGMARLRMDRVPLIISIAGVFAFMGIIIGINT